MNSEEAYGIWASVDGPWSPWVKPILFASDRDWIAGADDALPEVPEPAWLAEPRWIAGYRDGGRGATRDVTTAFVLDLPGSEGVAWGVLLARKGWRPVPLYNGVPGGEVRPPVSRSVQPAGLAASEPNIFRTSLVDVHAIQRAMRRATELLAELRLPAALPPAFLLDANRRLGEGPAFPGRFDNRSISLPTDFPSATFLRARGIERVVLVQRTGTEPQEDLAHTLLAWQEGGLSIHAASLAGEAGPAPIQVSRPSRFRALLYRFLATLGLRRHPLGGFGGMIPVPSSG